MAALTLAYLRIDAKRPRFKPQERAICRKFDKKFEEGAGAEKSRTDLVDNRPVGSQYQDGGVETVAQRGLVMSLAADKYGYHKMTDRYFNDMPDILREIQQALQEGNLQDLAFKIHALKSLGGDFPIDSEKAMALEQAVMENHIDKVREQLDEMIRLCLKTKPAHR